MADTLRIPSPERVRPAERGSWSLLLVPTGICLVMFVVAALW